MRITRTGPTPDAGRRLFLEASKASLLDAVTYWHATYLPGHFAAAGAKKYGYQPRKGEGEPRLVYATRGLLIKGGRRRLVPNPGYFWRKFREGHGRDPDVYTGASKAAATQSIQLSARADRGEGVLRGVGVMDLPRYFYQYDKAKGAPDKADEVTRTVPAEEADLAGRYERDAAARMNAARPPAATQRIA